MRLLVINPNISPDVTALIGAEARRSCSVGTQVMLRTAPYGVEYLETRFEALIAAGAVAEVIAENPSADAVVVAAFGDPGLPALKEMTGVPVIGITEAALCAAALQGHRFSIIAISDRITAWYQDCVEHFGLATRLASIRSIKQELGNIAEVQNDFRPTIVKLSTEAVFTDGADAVILAGAPLAGLARDLTRQIPVPVVDGVAAGVRLTEALVSLGCGSHRVGAYAAPPRKPRHGLPASLNAALDAAQSHVEPDGRQHPSTQEGSHDA
ncbi:aspartate/glutamate racemase family protein [Leekyejoonella antrihumi]|uniref:Asp/Glu/hydantoin racemase n=1 Tax=Leekyejoonella antrihumi TaxID=1660198 RepID=A0A563DSU4_9MICO|nr:aspartate/glutamate racemase family protein [Leekyejoonella antrihumi]TWP33239.1 Asp/Glu/hydantoin racemase [Leekyejoonella antrihumi]